MYNEVILKLIRAIESMEASCRASERHLAAILEILRDREGLDDD